jgi:hypothetical protein
MSVLNGYRSFNRSQKARVGGKVPTSNKTTWVNINNPRVQRDIARHSAVGAIHTVGLAFTQNDDGVVDAGGAVTARASGLTVDVSAINFTRGDGTTKGTGAAGTATVGAADATNPRIDVIAVNTTNGAFVVVAGTATAGATLDNHRGVADLPANRIGLAQVLVPATATDVTQANIADVRP